MTPMRRTHRAQRTPNPSLTPLLVQAGAADTLGSIATLLSVMLFCLGAYVLVEVIRHPLEAQPADVIGSAVMIALAATLLFYLLEPRSGARIVRRHYMVESRGTSRAIQTLPLGPPPLVNAQTELPFASALAERQGAGN
jgi:hypothetical protein